MCVHKTVGGRGRGEQSSKIFLILDDVMHAVKSHCMTQTSGNDELCMIQYYFTFFFIRKVWKRKRNRVGEMREKQKTQVGTGTGQYVST